MKLYYVYNTKTKQYQSSYLHLDYPDVVYGYVSREAAEGARDRRANIWLFPEKDRERILAKYHIVEVELPTE